MNTGKKFKVGIYLRLSRDDDDYKDESQSITNQRDFIMDYIRKKDNLIIVDEYCDDGFTGSNFERPGFNRLLSDIESKRIDCIITKDQSRFGRNELVPYYIKKVFPMKNVRYIAINNLVDTFDENAPGNKVISFTSIVDSSVCENTSMSVKAALYTKKRAGKHLCYKAPYGYLKDPYDKYKLIIDKKVAPVVIKIFDMFTKGYSLHMICKTLDEENIPIPSVYANLNRGQKSVYYGKWCTRTVSDILKDEVYIGNMCQCKRKRPAISVKKIVRVPKDDWIIVENTHEAIIDKTTFEIAQNIFEKNRNITKNTHNFLFKGFLVCKECGHTIGINLNGNKRGYCVCNLYRKYPSLKYCTPHSMPYDDLEKVLLKEIKRVMSKANKALITGVLKKNDKTIARINQLKNENTRLQVEIDMAQSKDDEAYMDKLNGKISFETYSMAHNNIILEKENNKKKIKENLQMISNLEGTTINRDYEKIVTEYLSLKKPNRTILSNLIDKVIIDENKNIEIIYKIRTPFCS